MTNLIRDYIQVKDQPTVVNLTDVELDGQKNRWITDNFYLSEEIQGYLKILRYSLSEPHGCGFFLIGHYGAGKSHFLSYVALQCSQGQLGSGTPKAIPISLLNFKSEMPLEQIIESALGIQNSGFDRTAIWKEIESRFPHGVFLIIDELSEFLKSKDSSQRFNEDVRLLQFLGEWASDHKLWIICAMQEQIEHTGEIESDLLRKIKDRFPRRLVLTPTHVKELIGKALLIKKPGYEKAIETWFQELKTAFSGLRLDFGDFSDTYPLHPVVLDLLEEIRDRFSQTRGIVDFTLKQLVGDKATGRPAFLERPFGELVTPDRIIDHFIDLLELQPEFQPIAQKILPFYRREMKTLFPVAAQETLAWRVLHLLILVHLSPRRQVLSPKDATWWLLQRVSRIDPQKNEDILRIILEKMTEDGAFLQRRGSGFFLNLADESRQNFDRILEKAIKELRGRGESLFECVSPLLQEAAFNPYFFKPQKWQNFSFRWHSHERSISVWLGGGEPGPGNEEMLFQIGLPWGNAPKNIPAVLPKKMEVGEELFELAALVQLQDRALPQVIQNKVSQMLLSRRSLFFDKVRMSYEHAVLTYSDGYSEPFRLLEIPKNFQAWVTQVLEKVLKRKYPQFERYAPTYGPLPANALREFMEFSFEQDLYSEGGSDFVKVIREAYLVPLGLLSRKGKGYQSTPLVRHDLVNIVMQALPHEPAPELIYKTLESPVYGLTPDQVHCLLLFLYLEGEIDITRGGKSYRECFREIPLPIQYQKLSFGRGLSQDKVKIVEKVCEGLRLEVPPRWGAAAERRLAVRLKKTASQEKEKLILFLVRLGDEEVGELRQEVEACLEFWKALDKGRDEIESLEHFIYEIGSAEKFLALHSKLTQLPERFEALFRETGRLKFLLGQECVQKIDALKDRLFELKNIPSFAEPDLVTRWTEQARRCYGDYSKIYQEGHGRFWNEIGRSVIWTMVLPQVARMKSLSLDTSHWDRLRERALAERCTQAASLDFQPTCICLYRDGTAKISNTLKECEALNREMESEIRLFFSKTNVKVKVRIWWEEDPPAKKEDWAAVKQYLDGSAPYPDVKDTILLDQVLSGLETYHKVAHPDLSAFILGKTWDRDTLKREFTGWISKLPSRIRFESPEPMEQDKDLDTLLAFVAADALSTGNPLPRLSSKARISVSDVLDPNWVKEPGLKNLERLGFVDKTVDTILKWVIEDKIQLTDLAEVLSSPLCRLAIWHRQFPKFSGVKEWETAVCQAYAEHERF